MKILGAFEYSVKNTHFNALQHRERINPTEPCLF